MNSFSYDVKNKRGDLSWVMKWYIKVYKVYFWGSKLVFFFWKIGQVILRTTLSLK